MAKKVRVNFTLDEDLYKKMKFYAEQIGINWSQVIEQSLIPTVLTFDEVFKKIEASRESDITKIRMMFQKLLLEITGRAYSAYENIEREMDSVEAEKKADKIESKGTKGKKK